MARSVWKGFFSEIQNTQKKGNKHLSKTPVWSRRSMILPKDVGKEFLVHNGKTFIPSKIDQEMVGQRFGEFSNTRKRVFHKMNKKKSSR
jgi:small subunit ribosomal protein S19|eukprot:jgi/Botrbrau1/13559/Bobra.4_2s0017.1